MVTSLQLVPLKVKINLLIVINILCLELASQGVDFSAVVMSSKDKPTDEETEKDKKTDPKEKELPKKVRSTKNSESF